MMIMYQVFQKDFSGRWYPLFGARYPSRSDAVSRAETIAAKGGVTPWTTALRVRKIVVPATAPVGT